MAITSLGVPLGYFFSFQTLPTTTITTARTSETIVEAFTFGIISMDQVKVIFESMESIWAPKTNDIHRNDSNK